MSLLLPPLLLSSVRHLRPPARPPIHPPTTLDRSMFKEPGAPEFELTRVQFWLMYSGERHGCLAAMGRHTSACHATLNRMLCVHSLNSRSSHRTQTSRPPAHPAAAFILLHGTFNAVSVRLLGVLSLLSVVFHVVGTLVIVIGLPIIATTHQKASWVFGHFQVRAKGRGGELCAHICAYLSPGESSLLYGGESIQSEPAGLTSLSLLQAADRFPGATPVSFPPQPQPSTELRQ